MAPLQLTRCQETRCNQMAVRSKAAPAVCYRVKPAGKYKKGAIGIALNCRHSASVTYSPICHWESGGRMAPLTQHSPSKQ
eukprot:6206696-Pleurochrysis_carterae.AAC.1